MEGKIEDLLLLALPAGGRDRGTARVPREKTPSNNTGNLNMVSRF